MHDAQLFAVVIDYSNLPSVNTLVHTDFVLDDSLGDTKILLLGLYPFAPLPVRQVRAAGNKKTRQKTPAFCRVCARFGFRTNPAGRPSNDAAAR
jgi:hypothetical protein